MNFRGNDPIYPKLSNPESTDIYRQNIIRGETSATVTNAYGPVSGCARVYYSYGNHFVDDPKHFHSMDDRLGIILYENLKPWRGASATVGFDFDIYSGEIPVSGGSNTRRRINEYDAPGKPLLSILRISDAFPDVSGRAEKSQCRSADGEQRANSTLNGFRSSATLSIRTRLDLKGNLAMGYRNPSFP